MTDIITDLINRQCYEFDPNKSSPHRPKLNLDKLFRIAELNGVNVSKYRDSADNPFMAGRIRMNVGNALRGVLRRDGNIIALDGEQINLEESATA